MTPVMTDEELHALTGYAQRSKQLRVLHERGFWRAWRTPITGRVILEREHYEAVCRGADAQEIKRGTRQPQVRPA